MSKIYISGKITGLPQTEYFQNFMDAELRLTKMGYSVVNPAKVNAMLPIDTTWEEYMKMSFTMLDFCDSIYMMDNWQDSKGARAELDYAKTHDLNIIYENK